MLRNKMGLLGEKLGMGSRGEVKLVEAITNEIKLAATVGWV